MSNIVLLHLVHKHQMQFFTNPFLRQNQRMPVYPQIQDFFSIIGKINGIKINRLSSFTFTLWSNDCKRYHDYYL